MKTSSIIAGVVSVCLLSLNVMHATAATNTIYIYNFDFGNPVGTHVDPTINLGDTVKWVLTNGFHSTTAAAGQLESWDSGLSGTVGFTYNHTFTHVGTYNYFCSQHGFDGGCRSAQSMSGHVTVVLTGAVPYQITGVTQQGSDILVSWITGGICLNNILQRTTGAADGSINTNYTDIFTVTSTLDTTTNYLDVGAATNFPYSYYRVRVPQ